MYRVAPGVAHADHQNKHSHWGHGYAPLVSADCTQFGSTYCTYTGNAENAWNTHGYPNGFNGGNPYQGCGQPGGWLINCVATPASVHSIPGCTDPAVDACTQYWFVNDPNLHLNHTKTSICSTCGSAGGGVYYTNELQTVVTHEYGHAIGLGHTTVSGNSVMKADAVAGWGPIAHDTTAATATYNHVD